MIECEIAKRYKDQQMRCPVHLSVGQEAAAVGVAEALSPGDKMVSTHRGHAHYLAKGGRLTGLIGELYGKAIGCSKGNGGSMHLIDLEKNFWGSTSIVAQTIPVGVGLAFADKIKGLDTYTAVCFGDAAIEEGVFHEAANFASIHQLNVLFVCENNLYSCFTRLNDRQPQRSFKHVADAHKLNYFLSTETIQDIFLKASAARYIKGPSFIVIPTYRHLEHCGPNSDDHLNYRPEKEVKFWKGIDPFARYFTQLGVVDEIELEIKKAFDEVEASPPPLPSEIGKYVYADNNV